MNNIPGKVIWIDEECALCFSLVRNGASERKRIMQAYERIRTDFRYDAGTYALIDTVNAEHKTRQT